METDDFHVQVAEITAEEQRLRSAVHHAREDFIKAQAAAQAANQSSISRAEMNFACAHI